MCVPKHVWRFELIPLTSKPTHIYLYTYMHTHTYTHTYTHIHTHTHIYTHR